MPRTALIILTLLLLNLFLIPGIFCLAQTPLDNLNQTVNQTVLPQGDLPTYFGQIIGAALSLTGSIFLFFIIYGGIIIMTAAGNEERLTKGKKILYWAIIGVTIIAASYSITAFIFSVLTA
ncbi:MAG: hypothetical protein NTZ49_01360 [Candidatus Parcubacteria bacterium]|nr:hypothetical protein [Candidatus Parcubacteria bacterium]